MNRRNPRLTVNSPEVVELLRDVRRCSPQSYYKVDCDGNYYIYPIRQQLVEQLGISPKVATQLLKDAAIPVSKFIKNSKLPPPEPSHSDPEAMVIAALEAAAKEAEKQEKRAKAARAEEATIRKRYLLVRQGSYHGVYNEDTGTQVLFHTMDEAREYLNEMIHGRDIFRSYYGSVTNRHRSPELQEIHY